MPTQTGSTGFFQARGSRTTPPKSSMSAFKLPRKLLESEKEPANIKLNFRA